jgi:hypothetical protein
VGTADDGIERVQNPVAVRVGNHESGQKFDCVARMASDLTQNLVVRKEGDGNELAE